MTIYNDTLTEAWDTSTTHLDKFKPRNTLTETMDVSTTPTYTSYLLVLDSIEAHGYPDPSLPHMPVNDILSFSSSTSLTFGATLLEALILNSSMNWSRSTSDSVTEYLNLLDSIVLGFKKVVSETLTLSSTVSVILNNTQTVIEEVIINGSISDRVDFLSVLTELISILDSNSFGLREIISENLTINDAISELYKAITTILESLNIDLGTTDKYINIVTLTDTLNLSSLLASNSINVESLSDSFLITIPSAAGQDTYLGYTFSPEVGGVTTYTNYNFNGCAKFNGKYYFYNSTGLYEYGGTTDDGSIIQSIIETVAYTFGTSNKKIIPQIYLGATNTDSIVLKVRIDGRAEVHYRLNKYTNNIDTQKIKIGKGLEGRYFQFELITEADEFNMESIEFFPIMLKRKI